MFLLYWFLQLDPGHTGKISAVDAAQFLKKSGLPDTKLGKVGHNHTYKFMKSFSVTIVTDIVHFFTP